MELDQGINVYNKDCMEVMKYYPDNYFDLAIVDPPYGIGESGGDKKRNRNYNRIVKHKKKEWDNIKPSKDYFNQLFRVSKNQIIWGANYYPEFLKGSMGWVFWDKKIGGDFSDGELAYTSFNRALRMISISYHDGTNGGHNRIHPTQKPVKLYSWLLQNYSNPEHKILDTHLGSGSHAIAFHYFQKGGEFVGCELDKEYFEGFLNRYKKETAQISMF